MAESDQQQLVRSKNQSEHESALGIRFSDICEGSQIYTSVWQSTMRIDDNTELCTSIGEPGIWSWWAPVFSSLVTAPRLCSKPFLAVQGGCRLYISLFNNSHEFWAAFLPSRTAIEFVFVTVALCSKMLFGRLRELPRSSYQHGSCSELIFGRLEPWLSYFSNVPDVSCKDRSGGYWFICRFLARVQMIISLRSELERWWTCHWKIITMSGDENKGTPVRMLHPTEPMVTRRSNMTPLFQPRIQIKKTIMKEQD